MDYYEADELHSPTGFGSLIGKDSIFTWVRTSLYVVSITLEKF